MLSFLRHLRRVYTTLSAVRNRTKRHSTVRYDTVHIYTESFQAVKILKMGVMTARELCAYVMEDALQLPLLLRHDLGKCSSTSTCRSVMETNRREIRESRQRLLVAYCRRQARRKFLLLVALATYVMIRCSRRPRILWTLPR